MKRPIIAACVVFGLMAGVASAQENTISVIIETADSDSGLFSAVITDGAGQLAKYGRIVGSVALSDGEPLFGMVEKIRVGRRLHFCAQHFLGRHDTISAADKDECLATFDTDFMTMTVNMHTPVQFVVMDGNTKRESK